LLNLNAGKDIVPEDRKCTKDVIAAIEDFQSRVMRAKKPDGRIDPRGAALKKLAEGVPDVFSEKILRGIMITAYESNIRLYYRPIKQKMNEYEIDRTKLRMCHFLAQIAHECQDLLGPEEEASGEKYEGKEDLGNTEPGDGKRFKGRGLIHLTGRNNYRDYGEACGDENKYLTDVAAKLLATDPLTAVDAACWFWKEHNLNVRADRDAFMKITRIINGGYNGLNNRRVKLSRAKFLILGR